MHTPLHLWIVGILGLLWNGGGAYDYLMVRTGNADYLAQMPAEVEAMRDAMPLWAGTGWGLGVWMSILGSLLLLLRSRLATPAFGLSLLGLAITAVWTYGAGREMAPEVMEPGSLGFSIAIVVLLVAQMLYARAMTARGILR